MSQFQVRYEHFKREDTTNSMVINLYDDNGAPITPSGSHTWTAKVATDDGYAGEFPVVLSGNDIILRSSQMTRLPHGQYVLEIWENNNGAVTIYPNAGFIPFEIHKNAPDAIGIVEPTKDINKIIDDLHKAGQNIKLGTVTTGAPGSSVIIRQRLENGQNLLDFTIPRGADGATPQIGSNGNWVIAGHDTGKPSVGRQGDKGDPPTLRVGSVTKVAPGGTPTASVTGSNGSYAINLGLPQGDQGTGFAPTRIPSGGDLNSLTTGGVYSSMGGNNFKNLPDGLYNKNAFTVMVYGDSNQGSQVIIDPITGVMYTRVARDNWKTWNAWAKIGGAPNLLLGTSDQWKQFDVDKTGLWDSHDFHTVNLMPGTYTYSATVENIDGSSVVGVKVQNNSGFFQWSNKTLTQGQSGRLSITFTVTNRQDYYVYPLSFSPQPPVGVSYRFKEESLVEWPSDQPWRPSPLDILANRLNKLGGVTGTNLLPNPVPQYQLLSSEGTFKSTPHLSAQKLKLINDSEGNFVNPPFISPEKGDTILQSVIVNTDGGINPNLYMTFFNQNGYKHHPVYTTVDRIAPRRYLISGSYTITEDNFKLRPLNLVKFGVSNATYFEIDTPFVGLVQSGGVIATNLTPTLDNQSSLITQGIGHRTVSAGNHSLYDDYYYKITSFEPSTRYRLSFTAWGSGNVLTHVYPGATPGERGNGDGQKTWLLNATPTQYSYEFDSFSTLGGDPQKTLLFRIPASDQAVDFYLDTSSVVLEKVGGVAKAPSQPQAAGLLYTGSFTVSTGSTPAWSYKAIPIGDVDGDTLTVTLTPHQTAGAKLDQICVALYDSTRTKALATYAYPATEQTSTITIVDKWPGKDAQLLFYSNDKTINSNTTIEFGNVTIVGS